jgi:hypothetical protein
VMPSQQPGLSRSQGLYSSHAVHIPIDRSVYAAAGKWTGEGPSLGSETVDGGEKRKLAKAFGPDQRPSQWSCRESNP